MPKIIAELCQNHLGQRAIMAQAIKEAAIAGADYIKTQIIFAEDLTRRERFEEGLVENSGVRKTIKRPYQPEYDRLSKLDLKEADYQWFIEEAQKNQIKPMMTIFSRRRLELASRLPWPEKVVKIASYDCPSLPFLKELCDVFDHLIISTGASFDDEIKQAANLVGSRGKKLTFLHCVTSYPNTLAMCHLSRMAWLKTLAADVGWSDHTLIATDGLKASKTALFLGADWVERHYTVLAEDQTKDGPVSVNPKQLKELVDFSRLSREEQEKIIKKEIPEWQTMIGQSQREMTHQEMLNRDYYRGRFASTVDNWEEKVNFIL